MRAAIAFALMGTLCVGAVRTTNLPSGQYVKVKDSRLVIGPECKEFYFAGWNMWEVTELGGSAPALGSHPPL